MTVDIQRRNRAIDTFNDCLKAETDNTLDTYWNRYEYEPAFTTIMGAMLPDPSEFHNALVQLHDADGDMQALKEATIALWALVYGKESQP